MVGYNKHYAYHMQSLYQNNVYGNVATIALYIPPFMFITTGRLVPTIILDLESLNFEKLLLKQRPIKQYSNIYRYIYMVPVNTKCKYYFTVQFLLDHPIQ